MIEDDERWRSLLCANCEGELVRLYFRGGRLTMDYRTTAMAFDDSHDWGLNHREWSSGIDVANELSDCAVFVIDIECKCRKRQESVGKLVDLARASKRKRLLI